MVKREVVGAHYGLRDWLAQRITAVVMAVYTLLILSIIAGLPPTILAIASCLPMLSAPCSTATKPFRATGGRCGRG